MIENNKVYHDWMQDLTKLVKELPTIECGTEEFTKVVDKVNVYIDRLSEVLGKDEFVKQVKLYSDSYDRINEKRTEAIEQKRVWTNDEIKNLLENNDTMVIRSLIQLYNKQEEAEKEMYQTKFDNGVGFNGVDAKILTGIAKFYLQHKRMSPKQISLVRSRIMKYSNQLTKIANGMV